jgi:hypothetical protein
MSSRTLLLAVMNKKIIIARFLAGFLIKHGERYEKENGLCLVYEVKTKKGYRAEYMARMCLFITNTSG